MRSAVFFEIDGVLNLSPVEDGVQVSPQSARELRTNDQAVEAAEDLKAAGYLLIATAHMPDLSRGLVCRREHDEMLAVLRETFHLDDILICPHEEADECPCCKPNAGLLTEAGFKWHLDLDHSFVISDKWQDAEAARQAGCTSLLLRSPWIEGGHRDIVVRDVAAAAHRIVQLHSNKRALVA